jgi:hypothetical protein
MELSYPIVIGTVIFFYIKFFNKNAKMYLESERTMTWSEFIEKTFT